MPGKTKPRTKGLFQNTWFLIGCVLFAVGGLIAVIAGGVTHSAPAIGLGAVFLAASVAMFISGLVDRQHAIKRQQQAVT